jgi:hypothetical protein
MSIISTSFNRMCLASWYGDHSVFRVVAADTTNANLVKPAPASSMD